MRRSAHAPSVPLELDGVGVAYLAEPMIAADAAPGLSEIHREMAKIRADSWSCRLNKGEGTSVRHLMVSLRGMA
jgi:hypothetical protein